MKDFIKKKTSCYNLPLFPPSTGLPPPITHTSIPTLLLLRLGSAVTRSEYNTLLPPLFVVVRCLCVHNNFRHNAVPAMLTAEQKTIAPARTRSPPTGFPTIYFPCRDSPHHERAYLTVHAVLYFFFTVYLLCSYGFKKKSGRSIFSSGRLSDTPVGNV